MPVAHDPVAGPALQTEGLDPEEVARPRPLDGDRTGHHVGPVARGVAGDRPGRDAPRVVEDLVLGDPEHAEEGDRVAPLVGKDPLVGHGLDDEDPTVDDLGDRAGRGGGEPTPADRLGERGELDERAGGAGGIHASFTHFPADSST